MGETKCTIFGDDLCHHAGGQHWACSGCWKKLSPEAQREYHLFFAKYQQELENWLHAPLPKPDKPPVYYDGKSMRARRTSAFPEEGDAEKREMWTLGYTEGVQAGLLLAKGYGPIKGGEKGKGKGPYG